MDGKTLVLFPNDPALTGLLGLIIIITIIISIAVLFFFSIGFHSFPSGILDRFFSRFFFIFFELLPVEGTEGDGEG